MPKFFQSEIAAYGGERTSFKNVDFKKNSLENTDAATAGTVLEFIPIHIKNPPVIQFIAYLKSFTDDFNVQFNSEQPFGRTDPYYMWKNNSRAVNITWDVPSSSVSMGLNNMNNLSWLLGALYPTFKETGNATSVAATPLFRVRFANLISSPVRDGLGLLCALPGMNIRHDVEAGFISVNPKNMGSSFANVDARIIKAAGFENSIREGKKLLIPKSFEMSCQLQVVHDHSLGWDLDTGNFRGGNQGFPYQVGIMREWDTTDLPTNPPSAHTPSAASPGVEGGASSAPTTDRSPADVNKKPPCLDSFNDLPGTAGDKSNLCG